MWGLSVTYTTSSGSPVASGNTIANSSASFSDVTNNSNHVQMLADGSMTLTLTDLGGIDISDITLSMRSNSSGGKGSLKYSTDGGSSWTTIINNQRFNQSAWNGAYSTSYVNISKSVSISNATQLKIKIEATANSLYCQSFTLTYTISETPSNYTLLFV